MKKHILLFLCCAAIVASSMAQPKTGKIPEKFAQKLNLEKLNKKTDLKKEKPTFSKLQTSLIKIHNKATHAKSDDWWEPETIYMYSTDEDVFDGRRTFSYANGKCSIDLWQERRNNQWMNDFRVVYTYDLYGNMIEILEQDWSSGNWANSAKGTFTYDSQNNRTSYIIQFQKFDDWEYIWKYTYTYDPQNNNTEIIGYDWDMEDWVIDEKVTMTYNSNNNMTEELYQYVGWDDDWENDYKITYIYVQNNLTEMRYQWWDDDLLIWELEVIISFTYNEQNNISSYTYKWFDGEGWIEEERVLFTYDIQNNRTSELWQYVRDDDEWVNDERNTYIYDENNNAISGIYQWWTGIAWNDCSCCGMFTVCYNNMQSEIYAEGGNFTATYVDPYNVGVKEHNLLNNSVKLYPNPVSDILHIETDNFDEIPDVKIYSIQGELLRHAKGITIDISSLQNGIYIANINGVCRKVVKQ